MVRRLGMVRGALLAAALASWAVTPSALAQQAQPSANEVAMAREQSRLGTEAARGGRWREALDAYQRAYQLNPRPQTLLNVGSAQMSLGLLVQGTETYRRFLQEAPADGPLGQYRATAEQALQDIAQRIPRVQINAPNLAATDSLTLDGAALSRAVVGARLPVDPGAHVLVVTRRGRELARNGFSINERQNQNINLDFPVAPPEPPPNTGNGNAGNGNAGNGNAGNGNAGNGNAGNGNAGNGDPRGRSWVGMGNGNAGVTPARTGLSAGASAAIAVVVILVVGGAVGGTLGALYGGPVTPPYVGNVGMGTLRVQ